MTDNFDWTPFEGMSAGNGPPFQKFVTVGDEIVGKIAAVREMKNKKKERIPAIDVYLKEPRPNPVLKEDGSPGDPIELMTVSVDKIDLVRQIPLLNPQKGDLIAIRFVGTEPTENGTMKLFDVRIKKPDAPHIEPAEATAPPEQVFEPF